jgi:hypothetical protein
LTCWRFDNGSWAALAASWPAASSVCIMHSAQLQHGHWMCHNVPASNKRARGEALTATALQLMLGKPTSCCSWCVGI